ncbi:MAG: twin-arginine translocase subunit TatC [Deltaproteobacteria bacterium]|jgi:sec-independent protein translocase protein TatC|nr:twin-arginine translocase subunit TatC [Deltaproteobacteria bacterium]MBW2477538.1 twin-arginine translocase subunit TatC [Deltaproteobacteria bacterium]
MDESRMPLTGHLEELRKRLIISGASWLVAFLACYAYAEKLFNLIAIPVRQALPDGSKLVFIHATEPFFTYLKIAALAGLLLSLPVIFWQIWAFVAPGLYKNEKRYVVPFVLASCVCFGVGAVFGYQFVFPMGFRVLIEFGITGGEVDAMLSMGSYLSLSSKLLLAFGLVFELPIVIFFLARMGIVDHLLLRRNRKFAVLLAFLIGAILTPPDVFSQTALAMPFIVLYEVGIWVARFFGKRSEQQDPKAEATPPPS